MKLAIISDEVSQDFERVIAFARDFQLDGIEIRSVWDKGPAKLADNDVETIDRMVRDAGVEICGVATPVFKCDIENPAEVAEHERIFERCLQLAEQWNAPLLRIFTGWRRDNPAALYPATAQLVRERLLPRIAGKPFRLGIENEYSTNVGSGDEVLGFFKELKGAPQTTLVWDPCNVLYMDGPNDLLRVDYPKVKHLVGHFHVKDSKRVSGGETPAEPCRVGDGDVRIKEHFDALKADGYNGWVSLETHWRPQKALSEKETNLPAGMAFSEGAEPASRECMRILKSWM